MRYDIRQYQGKRDAEIAALILGIQNEESGLGLSVADQPDLLDIVAYYRDGGFWIALHQDQVVGTIGLVTYGRRGALKKFFVAKAHRGPLGPAQALYDC